MMATSKMDMPTPMTLPSLQKGWTTSAATINQYKQQSTVRAGGGNNVEEERWQMGR